MCTCSRRERIETRLEGKLIAVKYQCLTCGCIWDKEAI